MWKYLVLTLATVNLYAAPSVIVNQVVNLDKKIAKAPKAKKAKVLKKGIKAISARKVNYKNYTDDVIHRSISFLYNETKKESFNKASCQRIYRKMKLAFSPGRDLASVPKYYYPMVSLIDSVCR